MYEIVSNPYEARDYPADRQGLLLRGAWDDSLRRVIDDLGIKAVFLNSAKGWTDFDCRFLATVPTLEEVNIIAPKVSGLEVLADMPYLTDLAITSSSDSRVCFDRSTSLRNCYLYWWQGAASIFACRSLRAVHLDSIKVMPDNWWRLWGELESFALYNCNIVDMNDVAQLAKLKKLDLAHLPNVHDCSPLSRLTGLHWLSIEGCKGVRSIEFVSKLTRLQVFLFTDNGAVETLTPLAPLHELEAFSFAGSTIVKDGHLEVLTKLDKLSMLGFAPRRHYTHKLIKPWNWKNYGRPDILLQKK